MSLYLSVVLIVIPSPIFMMISSEAIAIILALKGHSALWIALSLTIGQTIGFSLLYYFGGALCERWDKLNQKMKSFQFDRFKKRASPFILSAAFFGLPPLNLSCIAASMIQVSFSLLLPLIIMGRFTRYLIIAIIPNTFSGLFDPLSLPDWLQNL